jgi:hypothetical protein
VSSPPTGPKVKLAASEAQAQAIDLTDDSFDALTIPAPELRTEAA